jgi:antitoxin CptB
MPPTTPDTDADIRRRKLRFRAWHRGFREADLILGPFADQNLADFGPAELDAFEALIEQPDHDLYGWIVGQADPPANLAGAMLDQIRAFRHALPIARGDGAAT